MNPQKIEALLKRAPAPVPPPPLHERLRSNIALPASPPRPGRLVFGHASGRKSQWLGLAAGFIAVLLVGWGSVHTSRLTQRNQELARSLEALQASQTQGVDPDRAASLQQEIERLRGQNRELHKLRAEVAALRPMVQEMEALRKEHQGLKEYIAQQQAAATIQPQVQAEPIDARAQSIACINHLKQIGLAARIWANDNDDVLPPNFLAMTAELSTPRILHCPADYGRPTISDWGQFHPAQSSYEYLNPSGADTEPLVVLARCRIHGHVALSDGSVLDAQIFAAGARRLIHRNGRLEVEGAPSEPPEQLSREYYERLMMERYGIIPSQSADSLPEAEQPQAQPSEQFRQRYGWPEE